MCDQIAGLCIFYMLYSFWCFIYIYIPGHIYITILSVSSIHRNIQIVFILCIYFTWLSCCPSSATPAQLPQFSCSSSAAPAQLPSSAFPAQLPLEIWLGTVPPLICYKIVDLHKELHNKLPCIFRAQISLKFLALFWALVGCCFHTFVLQILGVSLLLKVDSSNNFWSKFTPRICSKMGR